MEIVVNGKAKEVSDATTIAKLIEEMDLQGRRLAVEVNLEIVPRSTHATRQLHAGDRIEIVHAIGGG